MIMLKRCGMPFYWLTFLSIILVIFRASLVESRFVHFSSANDVRQYVSVDDNRVVVEHSVEEPVINNDNNDVNSNTETDRETRLRHNRIQPKIEQRRNTLQGSPVILVPGDGGSQFEAKLNKPESLHYYCETHSDWFDIWLNLEQMVPYVLDCWVDNMRLVYDNVTRTTSNSPGVEIRIPGFGNTTRVEFLDPSEVYTSKYFTTIVQKLIPLGYERGISMRGAPYDFRKAPNELGEFYSKLKQLIEETYTINNDSRIMLVCHSMGCPNSLYLLNRQTQAWKDKYIKSLVTLGAPWGGAIKAMKAFTSGDNLGVTLINSLTVRLEQRTSPSTAFLMPSNRFWPEDQVFIVDNNRSKSYSLSNLDEFFYDINFMTGYDMWLDNKDAIYNLSPPGVEVHCLYGIGVPTMEKATYSGDHFPDENPVLEYGDGDGTVNLRSLEGCKQWKNAQPQNVYSSSFNGSDHMQILHDPRVLEYIKNLRRRFRLVFLLFLLFYLVLISLVLKNPHSNTTNMSQLQQQRKVVEQLKREAALKRINVSVAIEDLKRYIQDHENDDYLLIGFHSQKANPFREKTTCAVL